MPIENIPAAWWNPIGCMSSLTSVSASDLIWQMDTYYTISDDRRTRQRSAGCCHFEFRNKTSPFWKVLLSCTWSSRSARICMLSLGCIIIEFTGKLARQETLKNPQYIHQGEPPRQKWNLAFDMWFTFSFEHSVWTCLALKAISIVQTHNSYSMGQTWLTLIISHAHAPHTFLPKRYY